ncbi:MAG: hypothetical protein L6V91_02915 [Bacilli bacterium]|nr:MAG: hypothetical protein L6V91_02915 [Bacilli bacterium]
MLFKNYIILALVLIITIIGVIYIFMWYSSKEKSKLELPILDDYIMPINYNELNDYIVENKDAVIYTSVLNDVNIRLFENKFKNVIIKNNLNSSILYLDLTNEINDNNVLLKMEKKYGTKVDIPSVMVFRDGVFD